MVRDDHDPLDEVTPLGPGPGRLPFGSPRFARLVGSPAARRVSPRRLILALGLGSSVAWGLYELGIWSAGGLARWVARQPEHQIPFDSIRLEPAPPPYIRSGAAGILDAVRREAKYDETLSVLDTDLEDLRKALSRNPWIEAAGPVRSGYRQIAAHVAYRRPLAIVAYPYPTEPRGACVPIDRNGVEMHSKEELYRWAERKPRFRPEGEATPLIEIRGLGEGEEDRLGLIWKPVDKQVPELKVVEAAHLAEFLANHAGDRTPQGRPYPTFLKIHYTTSPEPTGPTHVFFLSDDRERMIMWDSSPGHEGPLEPKAAEKWQMLGRFLDEARPTTPEELRVRYLVFTRDGAEMHRRPPNPVRKS